METFETADSKRIDKLPPHSPESERAVIGCCLMQPVECLPECIAAINSNHFYELKNRIIWDTIAGMAPDKVDSISVMTALKTAGKLDEIGGLMFINQCQDEVISTALISNWLGILVEKKICRDIITTCMKAISDAYSAPSAVEVLDRVESSILAIRPQQAAIKSIRELVSEAVGKIESRFINGDGISGLTTGLIDLDRMSDGLHDGEMIVVAGFPATGKTALGVNIAVTSAIAGLPSAVFSAEMRPVQLVVRSICSEARVNFHHIREKDMPAITSACCKLNTAPLYIEQASQLSITQVMAAARRLKQKFGIRLVVIDYIQLLRGTGDNREQEISSISKGCKALAMELNIPVIALSQLNDDGKLRESRAIGQDADTVWKLENNGEVQPLIQPINLNIIKCRDGATGRVELTFIKEFTRFENQSKIDDNDYPRRD